MVLLLAGALFDIREFHHQVLRLGPVPLKTLEYHISMWIQQHAPKTNGATNVTTDTMCISLLTVLAFYLVQR